MSLLLKEYQQITRVSPSLSLLRIQISEGTEGFYTTVAHSSRVCT